MRRRVGAPTIGPVRASYAVVWREPTGAVCSGSVEASEDALRFRGASAGRAVERVVRYAALTSARTLRTGAGLIDGRTTLLLELAHDGQLHVAAVAGVGALAELAALLSEHAPMPPRAA